MKNSTLFVIFVLLAACAFFFTSCTLEKRHYRSGYYIQHTKANNSALGQQKMSSHQLEDFSTSQTREDSSHVDSARGERKFVCREDNIVDYSPILSSNKKGRNQTTAANDNKMRYTSGAQTSRSTPAITELERKSRKAMTGLGLIIVGACLVCIGMAMGIIQFAALIGSVVAPLGIVLLCLGIRKKRVDKTGNPKGKLKPWAIILIGIALIPITLLFFFWLAW